MSTRKKKKDGKRAFLIALCIILALALVALIGATIWLESMLGMLGRNVDNSAMSAEEYEALFGVSIDPNSGSFAGPLLENGDEIINILLIGQDRRDGEGRQRSDAMILCTLNLKTKSLTMTSFMRDMYVEIPGYGSNRINACYQIGGMTLLDECLKNNFGIEVDGNIEVDFSGFMTVIDSIGGIDIELNASEAAYLNRRGNWDVDNSTAGQWSLVEGVNHLTGEQALAYSRIRYIGNADFERTERQRNVLNAVMEECKAMNATQLNALLREFLPLMTTDMTNAQIISYAMQAFPMLVDMQIETCRIPADDAYYNADVNGMSVLMPNLEKSRELLSQMLGN